MSPAVDVLVPEPELEGTLAVTLTTVLGQTHRPLRVVITEPREEDGTLTAVLRVLPTEGIPVEVVRQGQPLSDAVTAEHVVQLEPDAILEPEAIERLVGRAGPGVHRLAGPGTRVAVR
jgi:hypothetical protein